MSEYTLKHTIKSVVYVKYNDLEQVILEFYGKSIEIPADQECGNYTTLEFDVFKTPKYTWDKINEDNIDRFKETGKYSGVLRDLLRDMVRKDFIPEGEYFVRVSW
jgi:hypothetical protein